MANGPTTTETNFIIDQQQGKIGRFGSPCAFMSFDDKQTPTTKPVIFDTGASLAITYDKTDFDGPLTVPKGDLRLGGMANGLRIEGIGLITWTFKNGTRSEVCVTSMAYYLLRTKSQGSVIKPSTTFR